MYTPVTSYPASAELADFIRELCPVDAHFHVTMCGVWVDGDTVSFGRQFVSKDTTRLNVVRAFTFDGVTHWTLEEWAHDNGYRCTLFKLSKAEFLSLVRHLSIV